MKFRWIGLLASLLAFAPSMGFSQSDLQKEEHQVKKIKRGGVFKSFFNRSTLRAYMEQEFLLSYEQLQDYIEKGGELDQLSHYDRVRDFFVGTKGGSLGSLYILSSKRFEKQMTPEEERLERLRCLKLLLEAGAQSEPLLKTALSEERREVLQLFIERGIKSEQISFLDVKTASLAEFLFSSGLRPNFREKDSQGFNFLYILFFGDSGGLRTKNRPLLEWLLSKPEFLPELQRLALEVNAGQPTSLVQLYQERRGTKLDQSAPSNEADAAYIKASEQQTAELGALLNKLQLQGL